ncbi:MAG: acetate/propionate family kinase [Gammaproteobacteria bacterium]|nr:acetate/propionate family kinase [Gammaproteobacteria bacterium]
MRRQHVAGSMHVLLTINAGSSSVRLAAFRAAAVAAGPLVSRRHERADLDPGAALDDLRAGLPGATAWTCVHRVVHGGATLSAPCLVDDTVERAIAACAGLAPLHNPRALAWIEACRAAFGADIGQVAVFDTGFFADLPAVAQTYALPHALCTAHGLRRYGFHGLAHAALWSRWRACGGAADARIVTLQLGSGCSACAIAGGRALDISMGFSPLEGLVMATRPGDLDAGLVLHLQQVLGADVHEIERLLSSESGLRGMAGGSGDMRELLARDDERARLAVEVYCYRVRKYVGAYLAVLGGADAIVFGGGVGEHAPAVRAAILDGLGWAGIALDTYANAVLLGREGRISPPRARVAVHVFQVDEAQALATAALPCVERRAAARARGA